LYDDAATPNEVGSATLADGSLTIERSLLQDARGDTVHIDLGTFSALNASTAGISGNGNLLSIQFTGGDQRLFEDQVSLDGSATLGFGLLLKSDSAISSSAHASFAGNLTLDSEVAAGNDPIVDQGFLANANSAITLSGTSLSASGKVTLTAHSALDVDADGLVHGDASGFTGKI